MSIILKNSRTSFFGYLKAPLITASFCILTLRPLAAQTLSGWDHSLIRDRQDTLMVLLSKSFSGETEAAVTFNWQLGNGWMFTTSSLVTDRGAAYVGARRERPDLPLPFSSGRFISGEVRYEGERLRLRVGRLFPDYHPFSQKTPYAGETISGDGIDWSYGRGFWRFENRITFLQNEQIDNRAVNRIFNFHALHLTFGKWSVGLGEFLIYTGDNRSVDWIWSNPFISYVVHNYDAYPGEGNTATEHGGDTDNGMFYVQAGRAGKHFAVTSRLYLDEFQVDAPDREKATDEFLSHTQLMYTPGPAAGASPCIPESVIITASAASAGFGCHRGLFTAFSVDDYSLLPTQTGRTQYVSLAGFWKGDTWHLISDCWIAAAADILSLAPEKRHHPDAVASLSRHTSSGLRFRAAYQPWKNTVLQIDSNFSSKTNFHTMSVVQYLNF